MVLGVILGRKSYSWKKYVFILMIVVGKYWFYTVLSTLFITEFFFLRNDWEENAFVL